MMENPKLSLLVRADTGLVRGLCALIHGLKHLVLWLLGLTSLIGCFVMMFEYGEGLADISGHEWAFMLLLLLLGRRHLHYSRLFNYGFWRGLGRLLRVIGLFTAALLVLMGLFLWILLIDFEKGAQVFSKPINIKKSVEVIGLMLMLLVVYLAAPARLRGSASASPAATAATSVHQEPTISPIPDKELSL